MYSLPAHKEFRFLLPALCLLMPYCGVALEDLASRFKEQCLAEEGLVLEVLDPRPALPACFLCTPCCIHRLSAVRHARRAHGSLPRSLLTCLLGRCHCGMFECIVVAPCRHATLMSLAYRLRLPLAASQSWSQVLIPQHQSCACSVLQALFEEARNSAVHSEAEIHASKLDFPLDRSAVAIARELSKKLDEAPQEGGCPFMIPAKTQLAEPGSAKMQHDSCPLSSSHAAQSRSQAAQTDFTRQAKVCPFSGAKVDLTDCQSQRATAADHDATIGNRCPVSFPDESSPSESPALGSPPDAASCPFNFGNKENIPTQIQPVGSQSAGASDEAEAAVDEPMTEDALREYEQAFSMDPDEAMLQAYAALLADKVAEADMEADDTPAAAATAGLVTQVDHDCPNMMHTDAQMSGRGPC